MTQDPLCNLSANDGLDDLGLLRTLVDSLPDHVYVKDTESRYVVNNLGHAKALGAACPEEIAGKSDFDFYPKELAERYRADEQEIISSGKPLVGKEEPSVDQEGNERWHSTTKVPLRDESGKVVGLVGLTRDVTERKEAEEALRESEDRFRSLTNAAFEGIVITEDGEILEANQAFAEMYGYELSEVRGMSALEFHAPETRDEVWRKISSRFSEPYESKGLRKDGTTFDVEIRGKTTQYGGRSARVTALRNITERKWAEEALKESEERYRAVMEQSVEAIYLYDVETKRVLESNAAFQRMMGYTEEELREVQIYDFIAHDKEDIDRHIHRSLKERRRHIGEREYRRRDGSVIVVDTSASVISYGGRMALCAVSRDITERKEAEEKLKESEERFRSLIQNASDVITILEEDGTIRYDSPPIERILGYHPEERLGKNAFDYIHPDDREWVESSFAEALDNPGQVRRPVEFRLRHKDGSWHRIEATRTNLLDDPAVKGVVTNSRDITERMRAEEKLRESEERHRAVVEQSVEGIYLFDPDDGHVLESNGAFEKLLGYTTEELLEITVYDFIAHDREDIERNVLRDHRERRRHKGERKYRRKDGTVLDVEVSAAVVPYQEEEVVCCVVHDVTERKALEERLEHQAFHDSLTGLPNRALFLDRLGHALARARREGGPVAVLFVDLDDFKVVNDSLGHDAGNTMLVEVAERLQRCVRPGDTVGRIFGDEFAILLEAPAGVEEARRVAERIQEGLQAPFDIDGQEAFVRTSIGVALDDTAQGEPKEAQPEEVLRHADLAMYEAKNGGKACYEVYKPSMDHRAVKRMDLESDLRRATEREEFEVHYQPKVLLEMGEILGAEALVRWKHPDRGLLPPTQFIALAEETGLINQIGLWVLEESCRQLKQWQERYPAKLGPPFSLCVNLSATEIQQPDLAEKVADVLRKTELDPRHLMLEISEKTAMEDAEQTITKLRELKDLGVELALDDFGTGYCSLVYLEHSLLDVLKIDRLLVHRDREDPEEYAATISAMTTMAQSLGLSVIVEGVETAEQLTKLKEMGCDMAQGFYFAKPLPGKDLEKLVQERDSF